MLGHFVASHFRCIFLALVFESPDSLWLPHAEKKHRSYQGYDTGGDVHQVAVHVIGPEPLRGREGAADDEDGRKHFKRFRPADHRTNQPERHDNRGDRKNASDHRTQIAFRQPRYARQRMHRSPDGAPRDWRGVGDQVQRRRLEGLESEANHKRAGDRHGRAEPRAAFDESAETEGYQQEL